MPRKCSVKGCRSGYTPSHLYPDPMIKVPVFRFPTNDPQLKEQWAKQIGRNVKDIKKNSGLCARHFPSDVKGVKKNQFFSPVEPPTLFLDCTHEDKKTKKRKKEMAKEKQRGKIVKQTTCVEDEYVEDELYDNASQDVIISSGQLIKLEPEHDVHHNVYNVDKIGMYDDTPVPDNDKSVSNYKDLNHENEHSDLIVHSLIKAVQAVFCQFISFNKELKIEGFIYLDIDNEDKREYVLNKNISRFDTECSLPDNDQDLILKRETSYIADNSEVLSEFKESDDGIKVNFRSDRTQQSESMGSGGFVTDNAGSNKISINEPQTLASVFQQRKEEKLHVCEDCKMPFISLSLLHKHCSTVHPYQKPKVKYHCSTCDKELEDKEEHLKHVRWHSSQYAIHCEICGDWFKTHQAFGTHFKQHDGYIPYMCSFCPERFLSPRLRQRHEVIHSNSNDKLFQCDQCDKKYKSDGNLRIHIQTHHKPESSRPHKCGICYRSFVRKTHYDIHMLKHSGLKPYQCETCGKGFYEAFELNIHTRIHSGERPFICELCGDGFISTAKLKYHEKYKHLSSNESERSQGCSNSGSKKPKKRFNCLVCNETFSSKRYFCFVRHIASHVEPALYQNSLLDDIQKNRCELCGLQFRNTHILKNHQIIKHFREVKQFECNLCPKRFHLAVYLRKHKMKHLGLKPFVCKICGMRYTQSGNLKTHMRNHTGDLFACDMCGKSYAEKRALVKHRRTVHFVD